MFPDIDWCLYAIIDRDLVGDKDIAAVASALAEGGAGVIQLRDKSNNIRGFYEDALAVRGVTKHHNVPFIINDRSDVALAVGADGVHVGQDDLPLPLVRDLLGPEKIIGVSVHNQREFQACKIHGPTYFGVGTIYATATKANLSATGPGILRELRNATDAPLIAIGGIHAENAAAVMEAGANGVAVASALLNSNDIKYATRQLLSAIRHKKYVKIE